MPEIVVLVSGTGSNLQAILDEIANKRLACSIFRVIADRECYGLTRATNAGVLTHLVDRKVYRENLSTEIDRLIPDSTALIVLAGFLSILDNTFINKWQNKIINIHPSLLPKYGGAGMWGNKVHAAVLANQEKESGRTVHLVTSEIDGGEIIIQAKVPVLTTDDVETLQQRVQQVEHPTLIAAIEKLLKV